MKKYFRFATALMISFTGLASAMEKSSEPSFSQAKSISENMMKGELETLFNKAKDIPVQQSDKNQFFLTNLKKTLDEIGFNQKNVSLSGLIYYMKQFMASKDFKKILTNPDDLNYIFWAIGNFGKDNAGNVNPFNYENNNNLNSLDPLLFYYLTHQESIVTVTIYSFFYGLIQNYQAILSKAKPGEEKDAILANYQHLYHLLKNYTDTPQIKIKLEAISSLALSGIIPITELDTLIKKYSLNENIYRIVSEEIKNAFDQKIKQYTDEGNYKEAAIYFVNKTENEEIKKLPLFMVQKAIEQIFDPIIDDE